MESIGGYFRELDHGAIRVGILHSLSGTLTAAERPLQQVLVMLIEQLNDAGGLLHRPVEAVIADPASDPQLYARHAEDDADARRGCGRVRLLELGLAPAGAAGAASGIEGLLFYPSQYEGEEQSPQVFYTGATPRQQALPAVEYLLDQGRRQFILIGTDYVYPRTTNAILKGLSRVARRLGRCGDGGLCAVRRADLARDRSSGWRCSARAAMPRSCRPYPAIRMCISS